MSKEALCIACMFAAGGAFIGAAVGFPVIGALVAGIMGALAFMYEQWETAPTRRTQSDIVRFNERMYVRERLKAREAHLVAKAAEEKAAIARANRSAGQRRRWENRRTEEQKRARKHVRKLLLLE